VSDVEVGNDHVYGAIQSGELFVFDDLEGRLDELASLGPPAVRALGGNCVIRAVGWFSLTHQ
jgi:hypothetical protein